MQGAPTGLPGIQFVLQGKTDDHTNIREDMKRVERKKTKRKEGKKGSKSKGKLRRLYH